MAESLCGSLRAPNIASHRSVASGTDNETVLAELHADARAPQLVEVRNRSRLFSTFSHVNFRSGAARAPVPGVMRRETAPPLDELYRLRGLMPAIRTADAAV
jgi:hypothetical protein